MVRVAEIKRTGMARNAKLVGLAGGVAGRAALGLGKRLTGASKDEVNAELMDKAAKQLFQVLGELKGGAMKVGQALSVMEAAIPEQYGKPYREALTKLQKDAPPLPADKVHRVLDGQLGTRWRERFASFDDAPKASASIGQVHKAVWHDGREVAVKIQYPGADEALRADLKTMKRLVSVFKQVAPGADVQGERVRMPACLISCAVMVAVLTCLSLSSVSGARSGLNGRSGRPCGTFRSSASCGSTRPASRSRRRPSPGACSCP